MDMSMRGGAHWLLHACTGHTTCTHRGTDQKFAGFGLWYAMSSLSLEPSQQDHWCLPAAATPPAARGRTAIHTQRAAAVTLPPVSSLHDQTPSKLPCCPLTCAGGTARDADADPHDDDGPQSNRP